MPPAPRGDGFRKAQPILRATSCARRNFTPCYPAQLRAPDRSRGSWMVASDGFAEFLREQLAPLGRVTMRRMFGKTGVFCDAVMLAMVRDNTLYFRVDDDNRATFKEAECFPPLNYEKKGGTIDLAF